MAVRFVENKWSVKSMIRTIMLSSAYRQTSLRASAKEEKADPENQLLWRQNRKRLEGDILRDSVLAVSGRLNPARGGPGVFPRLPDALKDRMTIKNLPSWTPSDGPEARERSVYVFQRRQLEMPFLSVMDAGVFQTSCERRAVSTTALQALTLLNDDFVGRGREVFRRAGRDGVDDRASGSRSPAARMRDERKKAQALIQSDPNGLAALCRILLNTNEFQYVD